MSLEEQIENIINTYIVCPDRGTLSSSYREEAITQLLYLIEAEKAKAVKKALDEINKARSVGGDWA